MKHEMFLEVRHYECDAYNHVNNATYLNYLEFARETALRDHDLDYAAWMEDGNGIYVQEYHLVYRSPAVAGEQLLIRTQTAELGGATVLLSQNIFGNNSRAVLEALVRLVWVGNSGKPTRIPGDWKRVFTPV